MSASELLQRVKSLPRDQPIDWASIREEIHDEFDQAKSEDDRVLLLGLHQAVLDLVERQANLPPDDLAAFRKTRLQDYHLLIVKEVVVGEHVCTETLDAVSKREMQAGRMAPDDALRQAATQGISEPHLTRAELVLQACVKHAREQLAKQMPLVYERKFDFMPQFQTAITRLYLVGLMWKYGEKYDLPTAPRERAFICLIQLLTEDGMSMPDAQKEAANLHGLSRRDDGSENPVLTKAYEWGTDDGALAIILEMFRNDPKVAGSPYRMLDRAKPIAAIVGVASFGIAMLLDRSIEIAVGIGIVVWLAGLGIGLAIHRQMVRTTSA